MPAIIGLAPLPSTVAEAIALGRRRILAFEPQMSAALADQYAVAWRGIERDLAAIEGRISAARAAGETVNPDWLRRQEWYQQTQASIDIQMQRFTGQAAQTVTTAQRGAVQIARTMGNDFRVAIDTPFAGQVNAGAFERWVSAQQPGSPIRGVIDGYGERVAESVTRNLSEGLGSGKGPREITRRIVAEVGDRAVQSRVLTLSRTELLRSFRGSAADQFAPLKAQGIILGYAWLSTKSVRTCISCIARDGMFFEDYPTGFHVNCRCIGTPVVDPALVPSSGRRPDTGAEWFAKQDRATQDRMLGSKGRIDSYRDGTPLTDFVGVRQSRTWGPAIFTRPVPVQSGR